MLLEALEAQPSPSRTSQGGESTLCPRNATEGGGQTPQDPQRPFPRFPGCGNLKSPHSRPQCWEMPRQRGGGKWRASLASLRSCKPPRWGSPLDPPPACLDISPHPASLIGVVPTPHPGAGVRPRATHTRPSCTSTQPHALGSKRGVPRRERPACRLPSRLTGRSVLVAE